MSAKIERNNTNDNDTMIETPCCVCENIQTHLLIEILHSDNQNGRYLIHGIAAR